jgi:hypothetical protein
MAKDSVLTGGCLCGGVRYEIAGALRHASHCHCAMCRKQHIFVGSKAPWYELADDLPKHETSPRAEPA